MPATSETPEISVIVAVHDVAGFVSEAIASLRAQAFTDFEALIIDDGSTDGSGELALAAIGDDPRFRVIRQDNAGLSGARNTGLSQARGRFVGFLDADDAYAPGFLAALHAAIQREGCDWACCAIALWFPDGTLTPHPALHATSDLGADRCLALDDACDVARIFPSAWNKLYRRDAIADLRFPEGVWFEDHEFFWAFAARSRRLAYVATPLYHHRRDREGQITGIDSDRVFEQFTVLDRVKTLIDGGGFARADTGFARLASRLLHERAMIIMDRPRRARFMKAARAGFARWGVGYAPQWDASISLGLGAAINGVLPLCVVVFANPADASGRAALTRTLDALAAQSMADFELHVVVPDDGAPAAPIPDAGLSLRAAERAMPITLHRATDGALAGVISGLNGTYATLFAPNEEPLPDGLLRLVNLVMRTGARLGFGGFERATAGYHDGWTDNNHALPPAEDGQAQTLDPAQALRIYPAWGNRIVDTALLQQVVAPHSLDCSAQGMQAYVLETALAAPDVSVTRLPVAATPDTPGPIGTLSALSRWASGLGGARFNALPKGWRGTLFMRLVRMRSGDGAMQWIAASLLAARAGLLPGLRATRPDPETPRWVRVLWWPWHRR